MIRAPIHIIVDADLRENGGTYRLMGGAVINVNYSSLAEAIAADDELVGGSLVPVYFVTDAQLATPRFRLMGNDPASGETYVYAASDARGIKGRTAIPVYDPDYP